MQAILAGRRKQGSEPTEELGGRWKVADELAVRVAAAHTAPATDLGSWAHDALCLTERVAPDFVKEVAEWSVLYAKDVSAPG